jgi:hypothetical protein
MRSKAQVVGGLTGDTETVKHHAEDSWSAIRSLPGTTILVRAKRHDQPEDWWANDVVRQ